MGKRTKFQTEDKAQLVLKVIRPENEGEDLSVSAFNEESSEARPELPKVCLLLYLFKILRLLSSHSGKKYFIC